MSQFSIWLCEHIYVKYSTLSEFSKDIGLDRDTIYKHIYMDIVPRRSSIKKYAEFFGVDEWFLYSLIADDS